MWTIDLEQSPAYFSRRARFASRTPSRVSSCSRTQFLSQPRSIICVDSNRLRERSRERSSSPWVSRTQKVPPRRRDSGSASHVEDRSRSPSPPGKRYPDPIWKRQMRTMPVEHSKFIRDVVSYILNLQALFDVALGCGIPSHIVCKAIEDNNSSDDDISLDDCIAQTLTVWWLSPISLLFGNQRGLGKVLLSCIWLGSMHGLLRDTPPWIPTLQDSTTRLAHSPVLVDRCPKGQLSI